MMEVLEKIKKNYSAEDGELLLSAYKYAEEMHSGQKRASGEPYFTHPCAVAEILIDLVWIRLRLPPLFCTTW